jgi:hypothetical protein
MSVTYVVQDEVGMPQPRTRLIKYLLCKDTEQDQQRTFSSQPVRFLGFLYVEQAV